MQIVNLRKQGIDVDRSLHCGWYSQQKHRLSIYDGRAFAYFHGYEISYRPNTGALVAVNKQLNHKATIIVVVKRTFCNQDELIKLRNQESYTIYQFKDEMKEIVECIMSTEERMKDDPSLINYYKR